MFTDFHYIIFLDTDLFRFSRESYFSSIFKIHYSLAQYQINRRKKKESRTILLPRRISTI